MDGVDGWRRNLWISEQSISIYWRIVGLIDMFVKCDKRLGNRDGGWYGVIVKWIIVVILWWVGMEFGSYGNRRKWWEADGNKDWRGLVGWSGRCKKNIIIILFSIFFHKVTQSYINIIATITIIYCIKSLIFYLIYRPNNLPKSVFFSP